MAATADDFPGKRRPTPVQDRNKIVAYHIKATYNEYETTGVYRVGVGPAGHRLRTTTAPVIQRGHSMREPA